MLTFAAIDIGSNSCRLKIASVSAHKLRTLAEDREVTRLGESVFQTGVISPEAMAATVAALKRFQRTVQAHVCDKVRVVATSAMRDARNAAAFIEWVKSDTGWKVEVISGLEEGRLIHLGVVTHEPGAQGPCLLIDLGGGSCEITLSDRGSVQQMVSLPLGAVRLQQEFLQHDPPLPADIERLHQYIDRELDRCEKKLGPITVPLVIATSGTAAALAEAAITTKPGSKSPNPKPKTKPEIAFTPDIRKLVTRLIPMNNEQRAAVPGIGPRRSEIILGGAAVYAALFERFNLPGFRYSSLGLRDGILAQMLGEADLRAEVHQRIEAERWAGVLELCKRYNIDQRKAEPVRAHAVQLFDALQKVHELPPEYRVWLQSAAMMQEAGKFMNHQGHHRHSHYIIANSEIFGFSPEQRAIVAAIARYLGKSRPDPLNTDNVDRPIRAVPVDQRANVTRAVVLLRLAIALNQDRASAVVGLKTHVYPRRVTLEIIPGRGGAELEGWAVRKEAPYFAEVFRRELFVEVI
jgi:exopolyphosphatase/guanosine-5'-triphosphate,3'-diphosphate pyrophosphatase